jgi:hypothetical protein
MTEEVQKRRERWQGEEERKISKEKIMKGRVKRSREVKKSSKEREKE